MNIGAVCVLTHNVLSTLRVELLRECLASIDRAFPVGLKLLLDNGSTDGSERLTSDAAKEGPNWHWCAVSPMDGNCTPGRGRKAIMRVLDELGLKDEVIVFSDDDMEWKEGSASTLQEFWGAAPEDLVILSGLLEPDYPWSKPVQAVDVGYVRVLERENAPGCAWSFRYRDWSRIAPALPETFGYDHKACLALREKGLRVAQVDLAEHKGWGASTHGNDVVRRVRPLDRKWWGV